MIPKFKHLTLRMDIIQFMNLVLSNLALSNNFRERKIIRILFLHHFNNWAVDQADGQSVKLSNRIIVIVRTEIQ